MNTLPAEQWNINQEQHDESNMYKLMGSRNTVPYLPTWIKEGTELYFKEVEVLDKKGGEELVSLLEDNNFRIVS